MSALDLRILKPRQTVQTALNPDALLRMAVVEEATGLSAPSIYRLIRQKRFPEPVRLGKRCTRFVSSQVQAWLRERAGTTS